jgi:CHAT domain-containing protein
MIVRRRWFFLAAALIALGAWFVTRSRRLSDPLAQLRATAKQASVRMTEGCLTGFDYAPNSPIRGSLAVTDESAVLRLRAAAALTLVATRGARNAIDQHAAGVAALLNSNAAEAIEHLEQAVALDRQNARYWSDLAVARHERSIRAADVPLLIDALVAVDESLLRDPSLGPAHFNRAVILAALHQPHHALSEFERFHDAEPDSRWSAEAALRMKPLRHVPVQRWSDVVSLLRRSAAAGDERAVLEIVRRFPQEARSWSEAIFLEEWASGVPDGFRTARSVAHALQGDDGESLVGDAVAAIDNASSSDLASLRSAHHDYRSAGALYAKRRVVESLPLFARAVAGFEDGGSPMVFMADYYLASCLYDLNRNDEALGRLDSIRRRAPARYASLHGLVQWERGAVFSRAGRLHEALAAQRESLSTFQRLREQQNAIFMSNAVAATLAVIGRNADSWRMRDVAFRWIAETDKRDYQQIALDAAARTEALGSRWDRAYSLLTLAIDPSVRMNVRVTVSSFVWRALAGSRAGSTAVSDDALMAQELSATITDPELRRAAEGDSLFARAFVARRRDAREGVSLFTRYVDSASARGDLFLIAEALVERARGFRSLGQNVDALADLTSALRWIEERKGTGVRDEFRDAFFSTADAARREVVDLQDQLGDATAAFAACHLPDGTSGSDTILRRLPPPGTLFVQYVALEQRLLIFALDSEGLHLTRTNVGRTEVSRIAMQAASFAAAGRDDDSRAAGARLASWLIEPLRDRIERSTRLAILPDSALIATPFASLPFGASRGPLIEAVSISVVADTAFGNCDRPAPRETVMLSVGNPAFDRAIFPDAPDLQGAEMEASDVAAAFGTKALVGVEATKDAVLERLGTATIAHLATHAFVNSTDASRSYLLFAKSPGRAAELNISEIEQSHFPSLHLLMLAGCRTGAPVSETSNVNVTSLATAFLRAGAKHVIGTMWDIDDRITAEFSTKFHRDIRRGVAPAEALRNVQLMMIHSSDPEERKLAAWSGFRAYACSPVN